MRWVKSSVSGTWQGGEKALGEIISFGDLREKAVWVRSSVSGI